MTAPPAPKKNDVVGSMRPADGVTQASPAIAPMEVESSDYLRVSKSIVDAHVIAPADVQRFVTHIVITALKFRVRAVTASKASHEFQIITGAKA